MLSSCAIDNVSIIYYIYWLAWDCTCTRAYVQSGSTWSLDFLEFRLVRMARVFRVVKLGHYSKGLRVFGTILAESMHNLQVLLSEFSLPSCS